MTRGFLTIANVWLAHADCFKVTNLVNVLCNRIGEFVQQSSSFTSREGRPGRKCLLCRPDGNVDIFGTGLVD